MICLWVCTTARGWTDRDAVGDDDSRGPKEPRIRWGPHSTSTQVKEKIGRLTARRSIYSRQNGYGADADWGALRIGGRAH